MTVQKIVKYKQRDGEIELKLNVLEDSGNYLIHRDILRHQLSQKQGTVATKTRSEVRGGGKKPWQQKGTGRARAGSSRSPLWRGGGVIFGPKPKTTSLKLNKKERKLAVQTLLYNKLKNTQISIEVDQMLEMKPKTKDFCTALKKSKLDLNQKTLLVVSKKTNYLKKSSQNLKNIELISASNLNTLSLLKAKQILITPLALNEIKEIYCD
jgi:large subunit ribosomal protein L4|uniref:ribosomal protein L4 n=1 Tax=Minidiscus spinulatus TaxID=2593073 RepID=UPI00223818B3|nr:ribosomal protein L4 [Minidiscus spinulatus]UYC31431.1 ribosomal protein L4 [Minidiscus spinulatus]